MRISDWSSDVCSSNLAILLLIQGLGVVAWISTRAKASRLQAGGPARLHSRPNYHGWYVTLWTILPACLSLIIWSNVTPGLVTQAVPENTAASPLPSRAVERCATLSESRTNISRASGGDREYKSRTVPGGAV